MLLGIFSKYPIWAFLLMLRFASVRLCVNTYYKYLRPFSSYKYLSILQKVT